jgi:antitoxin (DNA-binding transcriptional repressor) of toxin-antitoxin stability system
MTTVTIDEVQTNLPRLLASLMPGEEVVIVQDGHEIAKLAKSKPSLTPSRAGCYRKAEFWMAPDFDAPLDDFKEYME